MMQHARTHTHADAQARVQASHNNNNNNNNHNNNNNVCDLLFLLQPHFSQEMGAPFVLVHSLAHVDAGGHHSLELLLLRVQKDPLDGGGGGGGGGSSRNKGSGFLVTLEWVTVADTSASKGEWRSPSLLLYSRTQIWRR